MRWSTRLRGIGLLILLACHLVSSYHSQDYQIWDWGDRERKRIEHQPLQHQGWQEEGDKENNVFNHAVEHTLYRGHFDEDAVHEPVNLRRPSKDVSVTRWPSKGYLYIDDLITAEPSILGPRHHSVNQHLDINNGKHRADKDSDVTTSPITSNEEEDEDDEGGRTSNINVLNVSSKDSPYALINKYFSEREDNYEEKQSAYKKAVESGEIINTIKDVEPDDVWLSDGGLLVLKGGVSRFSARNGATSDRRKWLDNPWEPLDDYEAPYREPILPPPDFIPNDTGVGVPLPPDDEEYKSIYKRKPKKERALQDNEIKSLPPTAKKKIKEHLPYIFTKDDKSYLIKQGSPPPSIKFDPILDEEKYISEMENFRPERRLLPQHSPQPHGAQLNIPNELLLLKTKPLLVDHPSSQPNLVTILPPSLQGQPLASPSPLITPPTEHTSTEEPITTSTTTVASNTVSSLPPLAQTTPLSTIGPSYSRPSPTQTSGYYVSTSTPSSYSFAFQSSYKSKPLIVKNRARAVLPTLSPPTETAGKGEIKREIKPIKSTISPLEQITTPMYTTRRSPALGTTAFYNPIITTISPVFKPAPDITTLKSTPITIAIHNGGSGNHKLPQITPTTIKVTSPRHQNNQEEDINSLNVYKTLTPRIKNPAEAKYYKRQPLINSINTSVRDKNKSSSFPSNVSPPYHHIIPSPPQIPEGSFSPTISAHVVTPTPTILTLPPRDPETIFKKLSKEFTFGKKLFPNETPQTTHHSLPPSSNEIFSNEISDNDVGARRRASVVSGGNSYYLHNKGRGRHVRKLPQYHFTVGKFPSNPFIALKRKLAARNKKDKKRKRHFFRPWHSSKLASDSATVATNAISKLARPPTPTSIQRQLPFRQRHLRHQGGNGDGKIYVTRRPRYLSSVRRSGHGYASFFCGGKGCKSWGYTFRA